MVGKIYTAGIVGWEGSLIQVEADALPGPPGLQLVGLGDSAVKESRERIRSAISHSGFSFPLKQLVINLAPNDLPKEGSLAEAAIALAILKASKQIPNDAFENFIVLGSLSLDGSLTNAIGMTAGAILAHKHPQINNVIVPECAKNEACSVPGSTVYALRSLSQIPDLIGGKLQPERTTGFKPRYHKAELNFSHIRGQAKAKKALSVAIVGGHHSLLIGAPGTGKTMLARATQSLMPPLSLEEALELTQLYSVVSRVDGNLIDKRPFRSPHHTTSEFALVGGGSSPKPGEVSLAHKGVLFLDELLEFPSRPLQALREPLQDKKICISRAKRATVFPADFTLIAATNPCKCGYAFQPIESCQCNPGKVWEGLQKVMGPFGDRLSIELELEVNHQHMFDLTHHKEEPDWQHKVLEAQRRMFVRNLGLQNRDLDHNYLIKFAAKIPHWESMLKQYINRLQLTHRSLLQSLQVAFSVMDFEQDETLRAEHLEEAFSLRVLQSLRERVLTLKKGA